MARLAFLGDTILGREVADKLRRRRPREMLGGIGPILEEADGVIANLECAITPREEVWSRTPKEFHFRSGPEAIPFLQAANVRCVSLANNHVMDFGAGGLEDTIFHLDEAGIHHAGAGPTLAEARRSFRSPA